jgi:hypothetical protein
MLAADFTSPRGAGIWPSPNVTGGGVVMGFLRLHRTLLGRRFGQ